MDCFQSLPVRQFLLTNLIRSPDDPNNNVLKFRVPLTILGSALDNMADFPFTDNDEHVQYTGPTLFIRGTRSTYVPDSAMPAIQRFFPKAQVADVEAGHWLISENPEAFRRGMFAYVN